MGEGGPAGLHPRVARLKARLLAAPYEICLARALHFTAAYRETEGQDPHLRNALALQRTLERQRIRIEPDQHLAGSKTEKLLAGPLSVERGDFLRTLQLELDVLHLKQRPFRITDEEKRRFRQEILPYWSGRTVRDRKAGDWHEHGVIDRHPGLRTRLRHLVNPRFVRYLGWDGVRKMAGANLKGPLSLARLRTLGALQLELACNNPTPAVMCFDVQGHLSLGVDKVVERGMAAIVADARRRLRRLLREAPTDERARCFLEAVIISLEAAIHYAERFADLAAEMARTAADAEERRRLRLLARHCRRVPRLRPRTFHEAVQALWLAQVVGEIQYGTHDVFAVGRIDQYLYPYYRRDVEAGRLTPAAARALLQELFLKLQANVEPIPEVGMETNGVLGNSQHVVTIGGLTPAGRDATNELSFLILDAFEEMNGAVNQLSVRIHDRCPDEFLRRTLAVFRRTNGIALYGDEAILVALRADGLTLEDARDYCIVGCIETSGQSDTHGCVGGHELVLPAVLLLALTRGRLPPEIIGQQPGLDTGDPLECAAFAALAALVRRQLTHQVGVLVAAAAGKDRAYRDLLPAPYVSALMDDCIERATDATAGGARYDFTSLDVRGLATFVDSLVAIRHFVYERREVTLRQLIDACLRDFAGQEVLRQRLIHEPPKYGVGDETADALALEVVDWVYQEACRHRNVRGGRFRACFYSYGNHVIDGFMLGATPDGRHRGEPIANGVSPSNLVEPTGGPTGPLRSVARFPPARISSGVALNQRFHPRWLRTERGLEAFTAMMRTYFRAGGMHLQPNVVSTETLRDAQAHPERYRDLVVKVSGYSAFFTDLGKSIQEDIIARAEFGTD
ncbi:MAG: hypothetical protein HY906_24740 [Deltaproteobacteria bacterium]|nr:hypothetical protein [Deltaproteobacteria bacterium]